MTSQQPNLPALAKQGDLTAIAALMNRSLQPKGIGVRVAYKEGHLRVLLEGQIVPDQKILAPYTHKGIVALQIAGLHTLSVVGRLKGTDTPTWSQTFTLIAANTGTMTKPQPKAAPARSEHQPSSGETAAAVERHATVDQSTPTLDSNVSAATDAEAIAAQLNQAMGTEALVFQATVNDRILKLTAKTDQILEGDTFAKTAQTLLLPLNLSGIDLVQLYKQKTKSNHPYKIKEFTLQKEPALTEAPTNDASEPPATASTAALYQSPRSQAAQSPAIKSTTQAPSQPNNKAKFVMIGLVALFVVLLIGAIKLLAKPPAATEVCQDAAGAPGYCQLAVQMVGEQTLHDLKAAATPFTPEMEKQGLEVCAHDPDPSLLRKPVQPRTRYTPSIRQETIFPGIVMMERAVKASPQMSVRSQKPEVKADDKAEETVFRSACLLAGNEDQVELIKHVVLPNGWPEEPYKGKQEWEPVQRSLKVYQILIMLGGGTLFTAIGLFAASAFNFGFQIYTFRGLFQTASILGTLDTLLIVLSGGHLQLFGGVPLTCLALGITQVWVKDLRVDWASGYGSVALGVFLMMFIRFVLNWLLLGFIFSVL